MFNTQTPADELAKVRDEIRILRDREIELRKCFTRNCDEGVYEGCEFDVEVRLQKRCVLNQSRLPDEILNDPQYFDVRYAPIVRVMPRKEPRFALDDTHSGFRPTQENYDLVETFL